MVNPGGESTMLGHWRIVLRQAEEAARVGRFEEALALATRPDVADHHHAVQFRSRLALDLIARATRRARLTTWPGPSRTWTWPSGWALRRIRWRRPGSAWPTGSPRRSGPTWTRATRPGRWSGSRTWPGTRSAARRCVGPARSPRPGRSALAEGRRGEFGRAQEQLDRAERLAGGAGAIGAQQAVAAARADLETRQKAASSKVEALYTVLAEGKWPAILTAAEAVLSAVPEHPAARQARSRAWQQIAAIGPAAAAQWPARGARAAQGQPAAMINPRREPGEPEGAADGEGKGLATSPARHASWPSQRGRRPGKPRGRRHRLARRRRHAPRRWRRTCASSPAIAAGGRTPRRPHGRPPAGPRRG